METTKNKAQLRRLTKEQLVEMVSEATTFRERVLECTADRVDDNNRSCIEDFLSDIGVPGDEADRLLGGGTVVKLVTLRIEVPARDRNGYENGDSIATALRSLDVSNGVAEFLCLEEESNVDIKVLDCADAD